MPKGIYCVKTVALSFGDENLKCLCTKRTDSRESLFLHDLPHNFLFKRLGTAYDKKSMSAGCRIAKGVDD